MPGLPVQRKDLRPQRRWGFRFWVRLDPHPVTFPAIGWQSLLHCLLQSSRRLSTSRVLLMPSGQLSHAGQAHCTTSE